METESFCPEALLRRSRLWLSDRGLSQTIGGNVSRPGCLLAIPNQAATVHVYGNHMYIHIYMCICICIYVCVYLYVYLYVYIHIYIYTHTYAYLSVYYSFIRVMICFFQLHSFVLRPRRQNYTHQAIVEENMAHIGHGQSFWRARRRWLLRTDSSRAQNNIQCLYRTRRPSLVWPAIHTIDSS